MRWLFAAAGLAAGLAVLPAQAREAVPVRLETVIAERGESIWDAADIWIFRLREGQRADQVARRHATPTALALPPGRYEAAVRYGNATAVAPFTVDGAAEQTLRLNLDAGVVRLGLRAGIEGPGIEEPARWTVRRYQPGPWRGVVVTRTQGPRPRLVLDAGWYEVTAEGEDVAVSHLIEVEPGRALYYDIVVGE